MHDAKANESSKELLRRALIEATANVQNAELSQCRETAECSDAHLRRMSEILGFSVECKTGKRGKSKRRVLIAILVAAVLLLASCAVIIYQDCIHAFFEEVFESHLRVTVEETVMEEPNAVAERNMGAYDMYRLNYVPQGYFLVSEEHGQSISSYKWKNETGELLSFKQYNGEKIAHTLDVSSGETQAFHVGNYDVYHRKIKSHYYIWSDGKYSFIIRSSEQLSLTELEKIIGGVSK